VGINHPDGWFGNQRLVPTENLKWWVWFCTFLKEYFNTLNSNNLIVYSDREKGISDGVSQLFPNATQHHCCQHLAANVQATYGLTAQNQFWKIARAKTQKLFHCMYYIPDYIALY
jgi:hypothetical protein